MGTLLDLDISYVRKGGTQRISIDVIIKKYLYFPNFQDIGLFSSFPRLPVDDAPEIE